VPIVIKVAPVQNERQGSHMFRATILTLFPDMFPGPLGLSLSGDALARGLWSCEARDIREHGLGRHRAVDDTPAGGGAGMVLRADVLAAAIDAAAPTDDPRPRLLMSPRGKPLTQSRVRDLAAGPGATIVCGRFEGVDERVIAARDLEEVSIGDYVLSGGEIAALVLLDACVRLLPGVMGKEASGEEESFEHGLLEYPHYTRPRAFEGREIPDILLSGDHRKIAAWRRAEAERITQERRPDLLDKSAKKP
jgi:tRNA (guanine37-N1)-methyltransferase